MSATKDRAFVLRTSDYRDTSVLANFYTREHGKIHGILKGVRDRRALYGSTLEPFSLDEILFYRKKRGGDLQLVTQADCLNLYPAVRADLERLSYAMYLTELVDVLTEPEQADAELFDLMADTLALLESGASPKRCARIFEIKLLERSGLMPETRQCAVCRTELPDPAYFNPVSGLLRCGGCHAKAPADTPSQRVSRGALNFIEHVKRSRVAELAGVKVAQEVGEDLERMLRRFTDMHLQTKLKSVIFMEKMGY